MFDIIAPSVASSVMKTPSLGHVSIFGYDEDEWMDQEYAQETDVVIP